MKKNKRGKYIFRRILVVVLLLAIIGLGGFAVKSLFGNSNNVNANAGEDDTVVNAGADNTGNVNKDNSTGKDTANNNDGDKPEPEKEDIEITMSAVGDIMFHPREIWGGYDEATKTFDYKPYFEKVKHILEAADITVGNFEGTTAGEEFEYQGYPLFNAPDEALDAIKYAGFDVLSTVNNHCLDMRKTGVIRTIEKMGERGLAHVGTYVEKPETRVIIQDVKGIKIAFMAYTEMLNGLDTVLSAEDLDAMVNKFDVEKMKEDIAYAKENGADLIAAILHWGNEYNRSYAPRQKELADLLIGEGVNIILGSHPHVMQETEDYLHDGKRVFVAYSTGNFISNQRIEEGLDPQTEDGVILTFKIKKSGETGETTIEDVSYTPTWVYREGQGGGIYGFSYRILPAMEYMENEEYSQNARERMARSYKDTMSKLDPNFVE